MKRLAPLAVVVAVVGMTYTYAAEGPVPQGVPHLDHVFVILMENHGFIQIMNNPNAPFANRYARTANHANNYFAVGHPSLTNYLEIVGGSNFGVRSDNNPDWHNAACITNLTSGVANTDNPLSSNVCPIRGSGKDAETPALDFTNETSGPPGVIDVDGKISFAAAETTGKTIADQLAESGRSWKSYQESLPPSGADGVNFADGFFTDSSNIPAVIPGEVQTLVKLYAAKHNPFVYFASVQEGSRPINSLRNIVGFSGNRGLFADLASGRVPNLSFIAPNQCNDQHGRGNGGPQCDFDPNDNGTQVGLNPALIQVGDGVLQNIVNAIHSSPAWKQGKNAIVVVWDEDDFSIAPTTNQVLLIVDTNYGPHGVRSNNFYTHFSLTRTLEAGFGLSCLNHACDERTKVISDLFAGN